MQRKDDFMEKAKLNTIEYPVKDILQNGDSLSFAACGITDYAAFRNTLNTENLAVIEVYSEGGVLSTVFEGYTDLTGKFGISENEDGTMDVTVYLEKPDPVLAKLAALEIKIAELEAEKTK